MDIQRRIDPEGGLLQGPGGCHRPAIGQGGNLAIGPRQVGDRGSIQVQDPMYLPPRRAVRCGAAVVAVPPRPPIDLVVGGALRALLLVEERLPVGNRDLIIIGVDFAKREKAVAIAAVVDEGGLERRLDPRDFRQIDIAS